MKKILILLVAFIFLSACVRQSDLTIHNDTDHSIKVVLDGTIHQLPANDPPAIETFYLNSFILFGETIGVPIIIEGQTYLEHKEFTIEMKPNKDKAYHVEFDRAGFQINNVSLFPISTVQLKKEGEADWSENIIDEILYTESLSPTFSIIPVYDFIKITDIFDTVYPEELIELNAGETTLFVFFGS